MAQIPERAHQYRRSLTREALAWWGPGAPVSLFAGQIHQESAWRPDARSPFANGLAQFTPDTERWINEMHPGVLTGGAFDPEWALRALVLYDKWLYDRLADACSERQRFAFMLSAYNGGLGNLNRERRESPDPRNWFGTTDATCRRAAWACRENRGYVARILIILEPYYREWNR